ncbi:MAG TPA: DUF962 domain-containing protein [Jatrophihabitans sp.]|jgi:hypothetical protein
MSEHHNDPSFGSYREFFPYYVAMHSKQLTRRLHFAGTATGLLIAAIGVLTGHRKLIAAFPIIGYGVAWPSHWLIEGNNPATFGHPLWSLRGDFEMISYLLRGRDQALTIMARDWLEMHPENRTPANWRDDNSRLAA